MRMSELVKRSGVPLATIKYYLREGLLMAGESHGATSATYDEEHLRRLRLLRALTEVVGLPLQKVRDVLHVLDTPTTDLYAALGRAVAALPPYPPTGAREFPRAKAVLDQLGQVYDPKFPAVAQLERALEAAEAVGLPLSPERAEAYGRHVRGIAEAELSGMPEGSTQQAIEYAVIGTALHEPVLAAMRRLAHQHLAHQRLKGKTRAHRR